MVEGAALEMLYRGNSIEGSNPSLSVKNRLTPVFLCLNRLGHLLLCVSRLPRRLLGAG